MFNSLIKATLPLMPKRIVKIFAGRYIAGEYIDDAVKVCKSYELKGGCSTIDVLGEFVQDKNQAMRELDWSRKVIDSIALNKLDSYLSVKPTSVGLGIDFNFGYNNLKTIVEYANQKGVFVRFDMENSPHTSDTLSIYKMLRDSGLDNLGVVIQAYLFRSLQDVFDLKAYKPSVRLCKGIYIEDGSISFKDKQEIRENYKKLLRNMLEWDFKVHIATHDEELLDYAESLLKERNTPKERYEFQMLLGVTEQNRDKLLNKGHKVRIYVPFGHDWYGYSIRRLHENPEMAKHIIKAILTGK